MEEDEEDYCGYEEDDADEMEVEFSELPALSIDDAQCYAELVEEICAGLATDDDATDAVVVGMEQMRLADNGLR